MTQIVIYSQCMFHCSMDAVSILLILTLYGPTGELTRRTDGQRASSIGSNKTNNSKRIENYDFFYHSNTVCRIKCLHELVSIFVNYSRASVISGFWEENFWC